MTEMRVRMTRLGMLLVALITALTLTFSGVAWAGNGYYGYGVEGPVDFGEEGPVDFGEHGAVHNGQPQEYVTNEGSNTVS